MRAAPNQYPKFGKVLQWEFVGTSSKDFGFEKAAVGAVLLGP